LLDGSQNFDVVKRRASNQSILKDNLQVFWAALFQLLSQEPAMWSLQKGACTPTLIFNTDIPYPRQQYAGAVITAAVVNRALSVAARPLGVTVVVIEGQTMQRWHGTRAEAGARLLPIVKTPRRVHGCGAH
jgi:hypothetical protein